MVCKNDFWFIGWLFTGNVQDIKQEIISLLREKLPKALMPDVDEVGFLIMQNKNRQAWIKMDEIKKNPLWSPTSEYLGLMEKF